MDWYNITDCMDCVTFRFSNSQIIVIDYLKTFK